MGTVIARLRSLLGEMFMTTEHHPSDVVLSVFAAGAHDEAQRDALTAHVRGCAHCRAFVHAMEHIGGVVLDSLPPTSLVGGSLSEVLARL
jgi:putative transcriptional regulator